MNKFFGIVTAVVLMAVNAAWAAKVGDSATQPELSEWVSGNHAAWEDLCGKRPIVLFFWKCETPSVLAFKTMSDTAKRFLNKPISFWGIACDDPAKVKDLSWIKTMPFGIAIDDQGKTASKYVDKSPLPLCVVIDAGGKILWQCPPEQLTGILTAMLSGKLDLAEAVHIQEFTPALQKAISDGDQKTALEMIEKEQQRRFNPELTRLQSGLLVKAGDFEGAVKAISAAIAIQPDNAKLHIFRLTVAKEYYIKTPGDLQPLLQDSIAMLTNRPMALLELLQYVFGLPAEYVDPAILVQMAQLAKDSPALTSDLEKAQTQLAYARVMNFCGFNREAAAAAEAAKDGFLDEEEKLNAADFAMLCRKLAEYQRAHNEK